MHTENGHQKLPVIFLRGIVNKTPVQPLLPPTAQVGPGDTRTSANVRVSAMPLPAHALWQGVHPDKHHKNQECSHPSIALRLRRLPDQKTARWVPPGHSRIESSGRALQRPPQSCGLLSAHIYLHDVQPLLLSHRYQMAFPDAFAKDTALETDHDDQRIAFAQGVTKLVLKGNRWRQYMDTSSKNWRQHKR